MSPFSHKPWASNDQSSLGSTIQRLIWTCLCPGGLSSCPLTHQQSLLARFPSLGLGLGALVPHEGGIACRNKRLQSEGMDSMLPGHTCHLQSDHQAPSSPFPSTATPLKRCSSQESPPWEILKRLPKGGDPKADRRRNRPGGLGQAAGVTPRSRSGSQHSTPPILRTHTPDIPLSCPQSPEKPFHKHNLLGFSPGGAHFNSPMLHGYCSPFVGFTYAKHP